MTQTIVTILILVLCAALIGRKFYRQWRTAMTPGADISCESGCCGCSVTGCDKNKRNS
mgnify:CR=1 FL=1